MLEAAIAGAAERDHPAHRRRRLRPAGLPALREAVAQRFTARGVPTTADQILITNGALHGLDLLLRLLIGPGDRVLTELPTYPGALDAIRGNGARVVPVPMAATGGWQVELMQATLRQTAPRLAYLTPDFHNPTGALIDESARRDVLRAARQTGTTVVVDESFVDLGFSAPERPSAAIDSSVITIGSLSKPVWGGLRIGWLRASTDLVHRLAALRASIDMAGAVLDQLVAAELFASLDEIAAQRLAELRPQRDTLVAALARDLPQWRFVAPQRRAVAVGRTRRPAVDAADPARRSGRRRRRARLALRRRRHARAVPATAVRAARRAPRRGGAPARRRVGAARPVRA